MIKNHGGARKRTICRLQVAPLNVGGAPGIWRLLGALEAQAVEADVLMMQETRVTEDDGLLWSDERRSWDTVCTVWLEAPTEDGGERLACQAE